VWLTLVLDQILSYWRVPKSFACWNLNTGLGTHAQGDAVA
jgi:hypothetical protein